MRYYLIAGEASGDLHGSNLMKGLKEADPAAEFRFWGGDLMRAQGGELVSHYRERAYMGFGEVIMNLRKIFGFMKACKEDMLAWKPDVVILIDYPGFNLRMAKAAKEAGLKVVYYISPTIWAWKEGRVNTVKKYVDRMYCILPFETAWYDKHQYKADYYGHPLLDAVADFKADPQFREKHKLGNKPLIALLPGSRRQELKRIMKPMLEVRESFPEYEFVVAKVPSIPEEYYREVAGGIDFSLVENDTYNLFAHSVAGLIKSGTSTLEAALFNLPQVVCYSTSGLNYTIAKQFVKLDYVSLPNLIVGRELVRELLQGELNLENLKSELKAVLPAGSKREEVLKGYSEIRNKLGNEGASRKVAGAIFEFLRKPGGYIPNKKVK